jgi:hypothetical protein
MCCRFCIFVYIIPTTSIFGFFVWWKKLRSYFFSYTSAVISVGQGKSSNRKVLKNAHVFEFFWKIVRTLLVSPKNSNQSSDDESIVLEFRKNRDTDGLKILTYCTALYFIIVKLSHYCTFVYTVLPAGEFIDIENSKSGPRSVAEPEPRNFHFWSQNWSRYWK